MTEMELTRITIASESFNTAKGWHEILMMNYNLPKIYQSVHDRIVQNNEVDNISERFAILIDNDLRSKFETDSVYNGVHHDEQNKLIKRYSLDLSDSTFMQSLIVDSELMKIVKCVNNDRWKSHWLNEIAQNTKTKIIDIFSKAVVMRPMSFDPFSLPIVLEYEVVVSQSSNIPEIWVKLWINMFHPMCLVNMNLDDELPKSFFSRIFG